MSSPKFNLAFAPRHEVAEAVAPGVRRIVAANPGPMTFRGTNTYLIGEGSVTVLDPGPDDATHAAAVLAATAGERIERILLTHHHRDHAGAVAALVGACAAPVFGGVPGAAAASGSEPESAAAGMAAGIPIADGQSFDCSGLVLVAVATPGHASDHFCFALLGTPVLFSGDHVMGWSTTVVSPPDGSMGDYMRSLDRLLARDEHRYLPGHGGPIEAAPAYVKALRRHRKMREKAILERLARGDRTIPEIVAALYRDLDPRLVRAAESSVLGHLEDLRARGLVATDRPLSGDSEFRPAD